MLFLVCLQKRIPNAAQELPVRERVILNSEVSAIRWADRVYGVRPQEADNEVTEDDQSTSTPAPRGPKRPIVVELSNGGRHTADMVLVTVSLGVLKHSADALFDPPLFPSKMNAIRVSESRAVAQRARMRRLINIMSNTCVRKIIKFLFNLIFSILISS
jgi:hypothetical protein